MKLVWILLMMRRWRRLKMDKKKEWEGEKTSHSKETKKKKEENWKCFEERRLKGKISKLLWPISTAFHSQYENFKIFPIQPIPTKIGYLNPEKNKIQFSNKISKITVAMLERSMDSTDHWKKGFPPGVFFLPSAEPPSEKPEGQCCSEG